MLLTSASLAAPSRPALRRLWTGGDRPLVSLVLPIPWRIRIVPSPDRLGLSARRSVGRGSACRTPGPRTFRV